jgi:pimeloyl-ACP methyl ester carboxylesterase
MSTTTSPTRDTDDEPWTHGEAALSEVTLHYAECVPQSGTELSGVEELDPRDAGGEDDALVVLLHGFPECWYAWRHQLPALADAGYRVVAPDLRGYNRSSKPEGVEAYSAERVAGDIRELIEHLGYERAHVVGHDWGGVVAMTTALLHPSVVDRLAVLNAPYPAGVEEQFSLEQVFRSWYAAFFQLPAIPEQLMRANDFALLERLFRGQPVNDAYTEADIEVYKQAYSRPGALEAMVNYYRAFGRGTLRRLTSRSSAWQGGRRVNAPTLVLWGEQDVALGLGILEHLRAEIPEASVERFPEASHWLPAEFPEVVSERLVAFLD